MASPSFTVTALRQATVYGLSPRMRFDAVVNQMTLHGFREKRIRVHGGGKQWRPLVHVRDVADAFMLAVHRGRRMMPG
jgi:nucleoside-diphosphate-sugar epimerase